MTPDLWAFRPELNAEGVDLREMAVQAADGGIGKVQDVVERGPRAFLLVDTGPWIFGKTIKVPAGLVQAVDAEQRIVLVDRPKDEIKDAPEQDDLVDDAEHEEALARHYAGGGDDGSAVAAPSEPSEAMPTGAGDLASFGAGAAGVAPGAASAPVEDRGADRDEQPADMADAAAPVPEDRAPEPSDVGAPTPLSGLVTSEAPPAEEGPPAPSPEEAEDTPREEPRRPAAPRRRKPAAERPRATPARERADAPSRRTPTATDGKRAETPSRPKPAATDGKRAKAPAAAKAAPGTAKPQAQRAKGARNDAPLPRYDSLTAAEVVARLRALTQSELAKVQRYEQRGEGRQTILKRVDSLREKEPWRGYDTATVKEVRERLARAKADRVTAVRDYERRHRNRTGVMDAARRRLETM